MQSCWDKLIPSIQGEKHFIATSKICASKYRFNYQLQIPKLLEDITHCHLGDHPSHIRLALLQHKGRIHDKPTDLSFKC